jgi:hypothetical protein
VAAVRAGANRNAQEEQMSYRLITRALAIMPALRSRLALASAACLMLACGSDDPAGPGGPVFPDINSTVLGAFCWRGNQSPPASPSGTITSGDCDADDIEPGEDGYFEVHRVRVAASRTVTFTIDSGFDSYLTVVRINSISGTVVNYTVLDEDDDSGDGLDAMITVTLQPGVDYFVSVSGYDYNEVGPYTLIIN